MGSDHRAVTTNSSRSEYRGPAQGIACVGNGIDDRVRVARPKIRNHEQTDIAAEALKRSGYWLRMWSQRRTILSVVGSSLQRPTRSVTPVLFWAFPSKRTPLPAPSLARRSASLHPGLCSIGQSFRYWRPTPDRPVSYLTEQLTAHPLGVVEVHRPSRAVQTVRDLLRVRHPDHEWTDVVSRETAAFETRWWRAGRSVQHFGDAGIQRTASPAPQ